MNLIQALCEGTTIGSISADEIAEKNPALVKQIVSNNQQEAVAFIETMKEKVQMTDVEKKAFDAVQNALGQVTSDTPADQGGQKETDSKVSDITDNQQELLDNDYIVKARGEDEVKGQAKFDSIADLYLEKTENSYVPRKNLPKGVSVVISTDGDYEKFTIQDDSGQDEPLYVLTVKSKENPMRLTTEQKLAEALAEGSYVITLDDADLEKFMQATSDIDGTIAPVGQTPEGTDSVPKCGGCGMPACECPEVVAVGIEGTDSDEGTKSESDKHKEKPKVPVAFQVANNWID